MRLAQLPDGSLLFGGIVAGGRTHRLCPKAFCNKMLVRDWDEFKSLGLRGTHHIDIVSCIPPAMHSQIRRSP